MNYYLGIDPGKTGAFALISADLRDSQVFLYPGTDYELFRLMEDALAERPAVHAMLERAQAARGQGRTSIFTYGTNYGGWLMLLTALRISFETVPPKKWQQKVYGSVKRTQDLKQASITHASRMFPQINIGKSDGKADALNIALYAKASFTNG